MMLLPLPARAGRLVLCLSFVALGVSGLLGTFFLFFLNQDKTGQFTRLATMQDQFTMDASHSFTYRLDEAQLSEGKLVTTKQSLPKNQADLGKKELLVKPRRASGKATLRRSSATSPWATSSS
jgi:hypothetical protein